MRTPQINQHELTCAARGDTPWIRLRPCTQQITTSSESPSAREDDDDCTNPIRYFNNGKELSPPPSPTLKVAQPRRSRTIHSVAQQYPSALHSGPRFQIEPIDSRLAMPSAKRHPIDEPGWVEFLAETMRCAREERLRAMKHTPNA